MTRVLDTRTRTVNETLVLNDDKPDERFVLKDGLNFVGEDQETHARASRFATEAQPDGKTIAWIGGGMCVGPRLFAITRCTQTVHEIEPSFAEFCPAGVRFMPGDWRHTITGLFNVIVYDLGGDVPYAELERFLAPDGVILPRREVPDAAPQEQEQPTREGTEATPAEPAPG